MVQGFMVDGRVYLATRSGRTNAAVEAETLLRGEEGQRWIRLCAACTEAGYTPLFEFVSPQLSPTHAEPALTFAAARHLATGSYLPYNRVATLASRFQVPVVPLLGTWTPPAPPPGGWAPPTANAAELAHELQILVDSMRACLQQTAAQRPLEGCVLMLPSGLTLKLKTKAHLMQRPPGSPGSVAAASPNPHLAPPSGFGGGGVRSLSPSYVAAASQLVPAAPPWSPPLQFGPLSPPAAVVPDAPLAEAVHLLLACASDSAGSPEVPVGRVGHWAHRPSQKRLSHAASRILSAAANARRYPPEESAYARSEQIVSDALALTLHVAQSHGAPPLATGGYPVQQIHALLVAEAGMMDGQPGGQPGGGRAGGGGGASSALVPGGLRQVQSWPVDLLGCAGRSRAPPPPPVAERPVAASTAGFGTPNARAALAPPSSGFGGGGGAFATPLLSQMFASLTKPSPAVQDGYDDPGPLGRQSRGSRARRW
jgi:hypothetical protein